MTLYDVLQCDGNSTEDQLRQAYFRLARVHHPDRGGCSRTFSRIAAAWQVLGCKESRSTYDASLVESTVPVHADVRVCELPLDTESGLFCLACRCGGAFALDQDDLFRHEKPLLLPCDNCSLYIRILDAPFS